MAHVRKTRSSNKIEVEDLLQTIEHKPTLAQLPKAIKKAQDNAQTLDAPLEKHEAIKVIVIHVYSYFMINDFFQNKIFCYPAIINPWSFEY